MEGGAGNDTLTADDSNHLLGEDDDDLLNFLHGSYNQGEWGSTDGGDGDDTINIYTDAFVPRGLEFDVGGVEVIGGSGADEINVIYEINERFNFEPSSRIEGRFVRILDFEPGEDRLVIEIDRNGDTTDRDIMVDLDQTEEDGTYTSLITLTFAETDAMQEAVNILTVFSPVPFTLDDIVFVGL